VTPILGRQTRLEYKIKWEVQVKDATQSNIAVIT
jgi:hypothetical protein